MASKTMDEFKAEDPDCDEVVEKVWAPNVYNELHSHDFTAKAVIIQGELSLTIPPAETRRLVVGDTFFLPNGAMHIEQYGPEGGTYLVARSK